MAIDSALGRLGIKQGVCTSSTRPTNPFEGQVIYESDTNRTLVYDNAAWVVVADSQVLSIDDANNRVGIGTTSPTDTFEVSGTSVFDDIHSDSIANWNFAQAEFVRKASNLPNSKVVSVMLDGDSKSSTDLYSNVNFILHTDSAPTTGSTSTGLNAGLGINAPDTVRFGTSSAERMRIDSSGRVTMPYQPSFFAYLTGSNPSYSGNYHYPVWNTTSHNVGNHYSTSNGRFTAPVDGVYIFNWSQNLYNVDQGSRIILDFIVNDGGTTVSHRVHDSNQYTTATQDRNWSGTLITKLSTNDYVYCQVYSSDTFWQQSAGVAYGCFAGHLLG